MNIGQLFTTIFVNPTINLLVVIYHGLIWAHVPYALGFSIILLTVLVRLILYPLYASQLRASRKMQAVTPHINKLKEKHKDDPKTLNTETMKLYKEHGINPAAGCLPTFLQMPFLFGLYYALQHVIVGDQVKVIKGVNAVLYSFVPHLKTGLNTDFFGLSLGRSPSQLINHVGFLILLIPVATGLFQFFQSKMMFPPKQNSSDEVKTEDKSEDFAKAMQTQTTLILPIMIGFFAYNFPIGLSLYWNTTTIFGMIQQYRISGIGGLAGLFKKN